MSEPETDWFVAPTDLREAIEALASGGRVLAGGTDLVASMNLSGDRPSRVVWIGRLGLDDLRSDGETLHLGAGIPLATLAADPSVRSGAAALAGAAAKVAGPSVRNLATLGGSLCAAWPRSDIGCAALGLDASVLVAGPGAERSIAMSSFYTGPGQVAVEADEIVVELRVRHAGRSGFAKIGRRTSMTLAVVNAAVRLELGEDGVVADAVVAVGAGSVPQRARSVEAALIGRSPDAGTVSAAAARAMDDVDPADDEHASAWYRARVAPVAVARAITAALGTGSDP